ncbi:cytidylyltransferase domain-containing protein [Vibrio owensii]|uniref:cytidylyltransferase domain-containing protein n=1 Tax=Vibrio owensii TaxID=696485 RepID=UPI0005EFB9B8|nr:hypothetical protein [Vibrio owensii]
MKVVIPLQTCSTRVKLKNIRPFYDDKSLFDIKIDQLLDAGIDKKDIYVSSESLQVKSLCEEKGINFLIREESLTGNNVRQPDLVNAIVGQVPGNDDIMWVQVTSPLFNEFSKVLTLWNENRKDHDSLVAVKKFKGHLIDSMARPMNFNYGHWHLVSQKLPSWYEVLWSCFILKRKTIETVQYHIGVEPYLYVCDATTVDIDTEDDFLLASQIYGLNTQVS